MRPPSYCTVAILMALADTLVHYFVFSGVDCQCGGAGCCYCPGAACLQACQCACAHYSAGAPLELRKRRWITPALYVQVVLWFLTLGFLGARMPHACLYVGCCAAVPKRCRRQQPAGLSADARAVLGTLLVARPNLACWHGVLRKDVFCLLQGMVISTWVFAGCFL